MRRLSSLFAHCALRYRPLLILITGTALVLSCLTYFVLLAKLTQLLSRATGRAKSSVRSGKYLYDKIGNLDRDVQSFQLDSIQLRQAGPVGIDPRAKRLLEAKLGKSRTNSEKGDRTLGSLEFPDLGMKIDLDLGVLDDRDLFKSFPHVVVGSEFKELSKDMDVTLVTQTSLNHLHWLEKVAGLWTGPLSVAVFVPDREFLPAVNYVRYLRHCSDSVRRQVAFHFLFPVEYRPVIRSDRELQETLSDLEESYRREKDVNSFCDNANLFLKFIFDKYG